MGVGVECCFTVLFDSNQFSNCYIHVYEKEARSRLFKIQDLPLTYMFEYHRFEFQPNWFLILIPIYLEFCNYFRIRSTWRSRACSCTLWNTCLTVAPTPSHDPWPWTFHLINQSAVARMCCFTMGNAVAIVWTNHGFYSHCWSKDPFYGPLIRLLFSATRTCFICNS